MTRRPARLRRLPALGAALALSVTAAPGCAPTGAASPDASVSGTPDRETTAVARPAPVRVEEGAARALPPHFFGVNANLVGFDRPWQRPELLQAVRDLRLQTVRYPGGSVGNVWDWDAGWIAADVDPADMVPFIREGRLWESPNRYPLEDVARLHRETGVEVVFMLNVLTRDLGHARRALRRADSLGVPVRYVELGNEVYYDLPLETRVYPTPEDYGRTAQAWIDALRGDFPDAEFAVVAGGPRRHPRQRRWDERVMASAPSADAVTHHVYSSSGLRGRERAFTAGAEGRVEGDGPTRSPRERQRAALDTLRTAAGISRMMATALGRGAAARAWEAPPGGVWVTEWSFSGADDAARGTWANALFVAALYHAFLDADAVRLVSYHNLVGQVFPAVFTDTLGFSHVLGPRPSSTPGALSAGGVATRLVAGAAAGHAEAVRLRFPGGPTVRADGDPFPAVVGWAFRGGPGPERTLLVNLSDQAVWLAGLAGGAGETVTAPPDRYVDGLASLDTHPAEVGAGALALPPLSVTTLEAR